MSERARKAVAGLMIPINVLVEDALANSIQDGQANVVVPSFGLKTFNDKQLRILAHQVVRVLKPGARLSFAEVSVPPSAVLRKLYMFYVRRVIPLIELLLLGNPENYRLLTKAALHTRIGVAPRVQLRLRKQWHSFLIICRESGDWPVSNHACRAIEKIGLGLHPKAGIRAMSQELAAIHKGLGVNTQIRRSCGWFCRSLLNRSRNG